MITLPLICIILLTTAPMRDMALFAPLLETRLTFFTKRIYLRSNLY